MTLPTPTAAPFDATSGPVTDVAVVRFDGPDASSFLQGQLSSDVQSLAEGRLQRSSYNSAKGRMLADLVLVRPAGDADGAFRAIVAADLAQAVAARLTMFVLRAKVKASVPGAARVLLGVTGPDAAAATSAALHADVAAGHAVAVPGALVLGLPDGRVLLDVDAACAGAVAAALAAHAALGDACAWQRAGIVAGIPVVTAATSDQFVPQALNFDALEGISFRKGCYPGQEIVARMQYLGRLKERLFAFHGAGAPPQPGTRVFAPLFGDQPCGTVVNAAPDAHGRGTVLLAVVQRDAVNGGAVHLGTPQGPLLLSQPLPYPVPEPAPPRARLA